MPAFGHAHLRRQAWDTYRELRGEFLVANGVLGTNPAGAQCVNVPNDWYRRLGVPPIIGNASDWIGFHDEWRAWHDASLGHLLDVGDVAVFRPEIVGVNGHVDLVLDGSRSPYAGLDQNWPLGAPCAEVWHNPAQLAGVIRLHVHHS